MKNLKTRIEHFIDEESGEVIEIEFSAREERKNQKKKLKRKNLEE